jgi:hypothetical protein
MTDHPPLTRQQLDRLGCDTPGCDHTAHDGLILHSNCHPDTPTWAEYNANAGTLTIRCAECNHRIVRIAVAPGPPIDLHLGYQACWDEHDGQHCRKPKGHDGPHTYI